MSILGRFEKVAAICDVFMEDFVIFERSEKSRVRSLEIILDILYDVSYDVYINYPLVGRTVQSNYRRGQCHGIR